MATRWLYFRLFGLSATIATGAYWLQLPGLGLSTGLVPLAGNVEGLEGQASFFDVPTLLWLDASDAMLQALGAACVVCSLLVLFDVAVPFALFGLFAAWVSLVNVGHPFLSFQWDIMLCEAALLSIPYALRPKFEPQLWQRLTVALVAVKVTFESGIVKLTAGDEAWWPNLTALTYHYWTQPLPSWTSVFLDRLPVGVHQAACLAMFVLELGVPVLAFGTRRARLVAALGMIALQLGLAVAGNYSYFNLLVAALCVPLLDDTFLRRTLPKRVGFAPKHFAPFGWAAFALLVALGALTFMEQFRLRYPTPVQQAVDRAQAFKLASSYGVFRVMTKTRPEIVIEGSDDGVTWKAYGFKWKPGRLDRRPGFVAPWQPRLDWQMWFAAMGHCEGWVQLLLRRLLLGTPEVLALLDENPFPDRPPRYLRSTLWQYRFAPPGSSDWWQRTLDGPYCPDVALAPDGRLTRAQLP